MLGPTTVPRWSYAAAKAVDEHLAFAYAAQGLRVSVVRYFNCYGPGMDRAGDASVVAVFLRHALAGQPIPVHGDGHQTRCFTYIADTVRGTMLAASVPQAQGQVLHFGSVTETSIAALAEMVAVTAGSRVPAERIPDQAVYGTRFEDIRRRVPDIGRAREVLGWEPQVQLPEGLDRTVAWWLAERLAGKIGGQTWGKLMSGIRGPETAGFMSLLDSRDLVIGVIGLGYTGLPLAVAAAQAGFTTYGYDHDHEACEKLNQGVSHIEGVASRDLGAMRMACRFTAVVGPFLWRRCPTPCSYACPHRFGQLPDLSHVRSAARNVARVLRPGMLVIAQSTSYPGTTTEIIQPLLEESGRRAGEDFALAFSPERIDPGSRAWSIHTPPRIIGGVTSGSTALAAAVLGAVLGDCTLVHPVRSPEVAEFAKLLLENSYRLVNIGLVNELAMLAHELGIDIGEVIEAAATKPYGFQAFYPGARAAPAPPRTRSTACLESPLP